MASISDQMTLVPNQIDILDGRQLALNLDFLSHEPTHLVMTRPSFSSTYTVNRQDGTALFKVEREKHSRHHKTHIVDASSGKELFMIRKQPHSGWVYYADVPDKSSNRVFQATTQSAFFQGPTTTISFRNAAAEGCYDSLDLRVHLSSDEHEITYKGQQVGKIILPKFTLSNDSTLQLAPGIDPLLVVVLATINQDRIQTKKRRGAAGGAGGAAGGGGGGGC